MLMVPKLGNIFFMQNMIHPDKLLMHFKTICCPILKPCHPKNSRKQSYRWFWGTGKTKHVQLSVCSCLAAFITTHRFSQGFLSYLLLWAKYDEYQLGFGFSTVTRWGEKKNSLCLSTEPQTPNKYFYQKQGQSKFRL